MELPAKDMAIEILKMRALFATVRRGMKHNSPGIEEMCFVLGVVLYDTQVSIRTHKI